MDKSTLLNICIERFEKDFVRTHTPSLLQTNGETLLLDLLEEANTLPLPAPKREQLIFRLAYLLESVCMTQPQRLEKEYRRFISILLKTNNYGAKRSLFKIAALLLPDPIITAYAVPLATCCCERIIEHNAKPATQIWAMEILLRLSSNIDWLPETIHNLLETLSLSPLPSIKSRLKRWKNR